MINVDADVHGAQSAKAGKRDQLGEAQRIPADHNQINVLKQRTAFGYRAENLCV